nr:actin cytoskeleton-regulatory complex protein pan1-like [Quercus suber]
MGYKKRPQPSLSDLIEGQSGKSKSELPPPPPKTRFAQGRSSTSQSRLPPSPPKTSLPPKREPSDPKQKKDKGKRPAEEKSGSPREEDDTRRPSKQLKIGSRGQDRRVDAQPEPQAWLPAPMLHGGPLREDSSLRDFKEGEGAYVADALERCLLLPADMAELGAMKSREVFLCLKRYLGMAIQATYRLEDVARDEGKAADMEREKHLEASRILRNSKADLAKAREELSAMTSAQDTALSGLAGFQKQAEDQIKRLGEAEEQLKMAKELLADQPRKVAAVEEAKRMAEEARDEAVRAKFEADHGREDALATKLEAEEEAYAAGMAETEAAFKAQVPGLCRRYSAEVWMEAFRQAGVEASSDLWKEESVYYPPAIRETTPSGAEAEEATEKASAASGKDASIAEPMGELVQVSDPPQVAESGEGLAEEAPQEVAKSSSEVEVPAVEEAAVPATPSQAAPSSQGSEGPEAAMAQPPAEGGK